jgi:hypothetical protein
MAKKPKTVRISRALIRRLSQAESLELPLDDIAGLDPDDFPFEVYEHCVDGLSYGSSSSDLLAVLLKPNPGSGRSFFVARDPTGSSSILVTNLNDYREVFEQAVNYGHGIKCRVSLNRIEELVLLRCACPCDAEHASYHPDNQDSGGLADGIDHI